MCGQLDPWLHRSEGHGSEHDLIVILQPTGHFLNNNFIFLCKIEIIENVGNEKSGWGQVLYLVAVDTFIRSLSRMDSHVFVQA